MKKSIPRESSIVDGIMKYLNSLPGCIARKRHGSAYGIKGDPDIYGVIPVSRWKIYDHPSGLTSYVTDSVAQHFEVEVKRPGKEPTILQQARLKEWASACVPVLVATSVDDVKKFVEGMM